MVTAKQRSDEVEHVLQQYREAIDRSTTSAPVGAGGAEAIALRGAILSCVMGGKLSEGINFSDGLGRCVVVVGMPYANAADMELGEKMRYFDFQASRSAAAAPDVAAHAATRISGQQYYEDLCMKTVRRLPPARLTPKCCPLRSLICATWLHTRARARVIHEQARVSRLFVCVRYFGRFDCVRSTSRSAGRYAMHPTTRAWCWSTSGTHASRCSASCRSGCSATCAQTAPTGASGRASGQSAAFSPTRSRFSSSSSGGAAVNSRSFEGQAGGHAK